MRPTTLKIIASLALALLAPPALLQAQTATVPAGASTARVIVKYRADSALLRKQVASATERHEAQVQALGARVGLPLRSGRGVAERTQVVFASGMSSEALAARISREKDVEYAVPDRRKARAAVPNDTLYTTAGTPGATSGGPAVGQWYLRAPVGEMRSAINAEAAWDVTTGSSSVVVAVLDTGVRFDHPDLATNLLSGYDMVDQDKTDNGTLLGTYLSAKDGNGRDNNASDEGDGINALEANTVGGLFYQCTTYNSVTGQYEEEPSSWHGTQVSGLIGAITNNGTGMASVGRNVRVLPVRVLSKCGGWDSDITAGMLWAAGIDVPGVTVPNPNPAKVLNLSLGGAGTCSPLYTDIVGKVLAQGAVIVASAGNSAGHAVSEPANCDGVIGVGGLRHAGTKVGYSDLGPELSISAPAGNCFNTLATEPCLYPILTTSNKGKFDPITNAAGGSIYTDAFNATLGTSFSAPLVAGTAALMLSVRPQMSPIEVRRFLKSSARAFPSLAGVQACRAPSSADQDECNCTETTCGAGMLDAATAVTAAANAPIVRIDVTPAQPAAGAPLTLTSAQTALVAGRSIASWQWTLVSGGGIVSSLSGATTPSASATPIAGGTFIVSLTVTDSAGWSGSQTVEVSVTGAPPSSGGGGGGALGLGWLAALLAAVLVLARARPAARGA